MNDRSVRVAICIRDRVARQLACSMFSSAGAEVRLCEDAPAIKAAAEGEDLQAIVLGLGAAPEPTFDLLVLLRQWFATTPIYVITDAAGQRHAKRTKAFGATQVVPNEDLQRRVGQLVQEAARAGKRDDWDTRSPSWTAGKGDDGYEVQSMDLGAWLSVPGNRRLLGLKDPPGAAPAAGDASPESGSAVAAVGAPRAPITASTWTAAPVVPAEPLPVESPPSRPVPPHPAPAPVPLSPVAAPTAAPIGAPLAAPEPAPILADAPAPILAGASAPIGAGESMPCGLSDCARLSVCRVEHDAQNAAILEAHRQRDKRTQEQNQALYERLQAELRTELKEAIAASEARAQEDFEERVRLEVAAQCGRLNRVVGILAGVVVLLCVGLVWRLGPW